MKIAARLVLLGHKVDASAERLDEAAIGGSEIGIDHRREGDSLALGDHGESYGEVAGRAFDEVAFRRDPARGQRLRHHVMCGAVLHAAADIQHFQLGEYRNHIGRKHAVKGDERRVADGQFC